MIILEKKCDSIELVRNTLVSFDIVSKLMDKHVGNTVTNAACNASDRTYDLPTISTVFATYDDFVKWAIEVVRRDIPSPFNISYPSCYGLNVGPNFFTLKFPGNFGVGVKVDSDKNGINFELNAIFYGNDKFTVETDRYRNLLVNGWKVKPKK